MFDEIDNGLEEENMIEDDVEETEWPVVSPTYEEGWILPVRRKQCADICHFKGYCSF